MNVLAGVLLLAAVVLAATLPLWSGSGRHEKSITQDDQRDEPAPSDPDCTILGRRPENDAIFGTYPNLRVPTAIDWPTQRIPRYEAKDAD